MKVHDEQEALKPEKPANVKNNAALWATTRRNWATEKPPAVLTKKGRHIYNVIK